MKNNYLLPAGFKMLGLIMLLVFGTLLTAWMGFGFQFAFLDTGEAAHRLNPDLSSIFEDYNLTNELIGAGLLTGMFFIAFAKEKKEDERTQLIRLQSLQISHYLNYLLFVIALFLFNGLTFIGVMFLLSYIFLVTFILVYYCRMYLLPKFAQHEK